MMMLLMREGRDRTERGKAHRAWPLRKCLRDFQIWLAPQSGSVAQLDRAFDFGLIEVIKRSQVRALPES